MEKQGQPSVLMLRHTCIPPLCVRAAQLQTPWEVRCSNIAPSMLSLPACFLQDNYLLTTLTLSLSVLISSPILLHRSFARIRSAGVSWAQALGFNPRC